MPASLPPYRPSSGTLILLGTSIGFVGVASLGLPVIGPYHATAALSCGLCAAYINTVRPPRQKPVMASFAASVLPVVLAYAAAESKSDIISVSALLLTTGMISAMLVTFVRSALRA